MGQAATSQKALDEYDEYEKTHKSSPQTKAWAAKLTAEGKRLGGNYKRHWSQKKSKSKATKKKAK